MSAQPGDRGRWDDLLGDAVRFAWKAAIDISRSPDAADLPAAMAPLVRFRKLPGTATSIVLAVLHDDDGFRETIAGRIVPNDRLSRSAELFLVRPDGWVDELDQLASSMAAADEEDRDRGAARRVVELEARIEEMASDASTLRSEVDALARRLTDSTHTVDELEHRAAELTDTVERVTAERQRAVRELKLTEKRLADRTAEVHRLVAERDRPPGSDAEEPVPAAPSGTLVEQREWDDLVAQVDSLSAAVRRMSTGNDGGGSPGHRTPSDRERSKPGPAARRPPRMGGGLIADSPEGVAWLARCSKSMILVDGYNVGILTWGHLPLGIQRDRLRAVAENLAALTGALIYLVFDGVDSGQPVASGVGSTVRCEFTPESVEADDRILEMIGQAPVRSPVIVVSNDKRVRRGAEKRGAAVVGVASFVAAAT